MPHTQVLCRSFELTLPLLSPLPAVRIRPLNPHDQSTIPPRWQRSVIAPISSNAIQVEGSTGPPATGEGSAPISGGIKRQGFTFDRVLGADDEQQDVYPVVQPLVARFLEGYNATVLAYGQTSSGKSYTMGTSIVDVEFESLVAGRTPDPQTGIIPRAIADIFGQIKQAQNKSGAVNYTAKVSFVEIYNEELIDLLNDAAGADRPLVQIREDKAGNILWSGLKEPKVQSVADVMNLLLQGSAIRRTNETGMNAQSSRSHAIFSLTLTQQKYVGPGAPPPPSAAHNAGLTGNGRSATPSGRSTPTGPRYSGLPRPASTVPTPNRAHSPAVSGRTSIGGISRPGSVLGGGRSDSPSLNRGSTSNAGFSDLSQEGSWVTITSKFHFVDLAGSERLKRTAAQGDRVKEGISINAGLHALGNVISALGDPAKAKRTTHIPYRDSKLTRLLQDSLGGNSCTLMIACVAPTEYNVAESINTLHYANRARNIKNKAEKNEVEIGWDDLEHLQSTVLRLRKELNILRGAKGSGDIAALQAMDDKEVLKWQAKFIEESYRTTELTAEVTKLRMMTNGKSGNDDEDFLAAAEPIIVEYEKTIDALEGNVNLMKAALEHCGDLINDHESQIEFQKERIINAEQQLQSRETTIVELQARLAKVQDRESTAESYARDLETRLQALSSKDDRGESVTAELKKELAKLKEDDSTREAYLKSLEDRLAKADESEASLRAQVERVEKDLERRNEAYKELQERLQMMDNGEQSRVLAEDYQRIEESNLELRAELDAIKAARDDAVKERGRLNDAVAQHELHRGGLEDKIRDLEAAVAAAAVAAPSQTPVTSSDTDRSVEDEQDAQSAVDEHTNGNGAPVFEDSKLAALQSELATLRQEVVEAHEQETKARSQLASLTAEHNRALADMHKLNLQLSAAKLTSPSTKARQIDGEEEMEEVRSVDASVRPSRRGSFVYNSGDRPEVSATTPARPSLSRRSSGSFFGYNPRQGGLDSPSSRQSQERPRSFSSSLSQDLSLVFGGNGSNANTSLGSSSSRPLSLLTGATSVPASPTTTITALGLMANSPGGPRPSTTSLVEAGRRGATTATSYDQRQTTLEKGILSLQEALKKRDVEIAVLEEELRQTRGASSSAAETTRANGVEAIGSSRSASSLSSPSSPIVADGSALLVPRPEEATPTADKLHQLTAALARERQKVETLERQQLDQSKLLTTEIENLRAQLQAKAGTRTSDTLRVVPRTLADDEQVTQELEELRQQLAQSRSQLVEQEQAFEEKMQSIRKEQTSRASTSSSQRAPSAAEVAHHTEALASLAEEHQTMMEMTIAEHQSVLDKLIRDHADALQSRNAAHATALLTAEKVHENALTQASREKKMLVDRITRDHRAELDAVNSEHSRNLASQLAEKDSSLQLLRSEYDAKAKALELKHADELLQLRNDHETVVSQHKAQLEAAIADATQKSEAGRETASNDAIANLEGQHRARLDSLRARADIERQKAPDEAYLEHETDRSQLIADHQANITDLQQRHEESVKNLSRRLSSFKDVDGDDVDVDTLRLELSETSDALVTLEDALTSTTMERDHLAAELEELRSSEGGQGRSSDQYRSEAVALRNELEAHKATLANLKTDLQRSKAEVSTISRERAEQDRLLRELQDKINTMSSNQTSRGSMSRARSPTSEDSATPISPSTMSGVFGRSHTSRQSAPPPNPPPSVPPPPTPAQAFASSPQRGSTGPRGSVTSMLSRSDSPGPPSSSSVIMSNGTGAPMLSRSSSATSMHTTNGMAPAEAKKLMSEQSEELNRLASQLQHCEADLQANIDLVATLEGALNDSERNLRKSRVQLSEVTRERDRYSQQADELRDQVSRAEREVEKVKNGVLLEKQEMEAKFKAERSAKEKATRDFEMRMEEINRKKNSKLFCM